MDKIDNNRLKVNFTVFNIALIIISALNYKTMFPTILKLKGTFVESKTFINFLYLLFEFLAISFGVMFLVFVFCGIIEVIFDYTKEHSSLNIWLIVSLVVFSLVMILIAFF